MGTRILITGRPGSGKTTLVKRLAEELKRRDVPVSGFITQEMRDSSAGDRCGFEAVDLSDHANRATLASTKAPPGRRCPRVGKYHVYLEEFESLALPILENPHGIVLIDEIGRMELYSSRFSEAIGRIMLERQDLSMIFTVPLRSEGLHVVERLKHDVGDLVTVTRENREGDELLNEILERLNVT